MLRKKKKAEKSSASQFLLTFIFCFLCCFQVSPFSSYKPAELSKGVVGVLSFNHSSHLAAKQDVPTHVDLPFWSLLLGAALNRLGSGLWEKAVMTTSVQKRRPEESKRNCVMSQISSVELFRDIANTRCVKYFICHRTFQENASPLSPWPLQSLLFLLPSSKCYFACQTFLSLLFTSHNISSHFSLKNQSPILLITVYLHHRFISCSLLMSNKILLLCFSYYGCPWWELLDVFNYQKFNLF